MALELTSEGLQCVQDERLVLSEPCTDAYPVVATPTRWSAQLRLRLRLL